MLRPCSKYHRGSKIYKLKTRTHWYLISLLVVVVVVTVASTLKKVLGVSSPCWCAVTRRNDLITHLSTSSSLLHRDRTHYVSHKSISVHCLLNLHRKLSSRNVQSLKLFKYFKFSGICRTCCSSDILKPCCRVSYPWGCCPYLGSTRSHLFFPL